MRKLSKKYLGKQEEKRGAMLVTVLFIVAIAIIFISTAMMISVASRGRLYTNAVDEQARLTLYSLSQTVWQAIYSQEINDDQLVTLATNNAVLTFDSDAAPGLGQGGSTAKAYFWTTDSAATPTSVAGYTYYRVSKIYIEFEVQIDGKYEYYTMALQCNPSIPKTGGGFDFCVELNGQSGTLNSIVAGYKPDNTEGYSGHERVDSEDNIIFLHGDRINSQDNFGWYSTLLVDGILSFNDAYFASNVYFLGSRATIDVSRGQIMNSPNCDMYFYGTDTPFTGNNAYFNMKARNYFFDRINDTNRGVIYGFGDSATITIPMTDAGHWTGTPVLSFEDGISHNLGSNFTTRRFGTSDGASPVESTYRSYVRWSEADGRYIAVNPAPEVINTVSDAIDNYRLDMATGAEETTFDDEGYSFTGGDCYSIVNESGGQVSLDRQVSVNISGGDVYLYFPDGISFKTGGYIIVNGSGNRDASGRPYNLYMVLGAGAVFSFDNVNSNGAGCGVIDVRCFTSGGTGVSRSGYFNPSNLNSSVAPSVYLFSLGSGGQTYQMTWNQQHDEVFTGYVGFYPTDSSDHGAGVDFRSCNIDQVFYGRLAVSDIHKDNGNFIYLPYCPRQSSTPQNTTIPQRDGTDYNVVPTECGFYTYSA